MFKKSIFSQTFFYTVFVVLFSFLVMGTLMYSMLGNYLLQSKEDSLTEVAESLSDFTVKLARHNVSYPKDNYQMNVDALSVSSESFIVVLDSHGKVIVTTSGYEAANIRKEYYENVINGQSVRFTDTFGGLFNTTTLTIGLPIRYENAILGAVFVSVPVPEINQVRYGIIQIFFFSASLVLAVALVVMYTLSLRITRPLKVLNNAAKAIAQGHWEQRVTIAEQNEIGELGDAFNKMADSIQQLENMRSSFVANISHDLRTPMTTITGFVEGILDGTIPPEKEKQYLSIVLDETKRLSRLVTDLLDLTKLEQGSFKFENKEFDINETIRLSVIKLEKRIMEKDIHLSIGFQTDNLRVFADRDAIQRVITNLMDNAIKFTDEGGFIDIRTGLSDKNKVFVSIQNSGIGIEEQDLKHIFDRFYKTDKSRSLDKNGAGLGLFIVKSIMMAHGENVWAESQPGEFTRFSFTLPPASKESSEKNPLNSQ